MRSIFSNRLTLSLSKGESRMTAMSPLKFFLIMCLCGAVATCGLLMVG